MVAYSLHCLHALHGVGGWLARPSWGAMTRRKLRQLLLAALLSVAVVALSLRRQGLRQAPRMCQAASR